MTKLKDFFIKNKVGVFITALFCTVCWGLCYPLIKLNQNYFSVESTDIFSQFFLAGVRMTFSGILIFIICFITKSFCLPEKKQWTGVIFITLFQTIIHYALTYLGQGMTDGSKTPILKEISAFFIILIMNFVSKDDKLTLNKIIGCLLGFSGVVIINLSGGFNFNIQPGDIIIIGAALSNAIGQVFLKFSSSSARSPFTIVAFSHFTGGLIMLLIGIIGGGKLIATGTASYFLLIAIVFTTAIPYMLWSQLYKYNKASIMSVYCLMTPMFGMLFTSLFFGNSNVFSLYSVGALVLIFLGILCVNLHFGKKSDSINSEKTDNLTDRDITNGLNQ